MPDEALDLRRVAEKTTWIILSRSTHIESAFFTRGSSSSRFLSFR